MGLKAKIREYEQREYMYKLRIESLYATLKQIVIDCGENTGKTWRLNISLPDVEEMKKFAIFAEPTDDDRMQIEITKAEEPDEDT